MVRSTPADDTISLKEESGRVQSANSYKRYMTPQLTAELSHFSGLSLRLEDNPTVKEDVLVNFPLKHGKPFVIGVISESGVMMSYH